jgi:FixJ family two-component response regulator
MVAGAIIGVVDDDEGIRVALDELLQSAGFRVVTFSSAKALLSSMCLHKLACLILDLHMPGMDGLSLQRHLADAGYRIPIVVLTAHGDGETRARAVDEGAVAFLTKPLDSELILAAVTRAVESIT